MVCGDAIVIDEINGERGLKSLVSGRPKNPANFRWETVEYCATTSTVTLRNSCLKTVGLFDETLRRSAEDWSMWVRISREYDMRYFEQPLVKYRIHGANATSNLDRINDGNRYAASRIVESSQFWNYPSHFRAKLLFYRFATAWRFEPKGKALGYFMRAIATDPTQLPYGLHVINLGLRNTFNRRRGKG
jgi:hypothetical protein